MASAALCFTCDGFEFLGFGRRQLLQSMEDVPQLKAVS
jgi:hypothetical protein